MWPGVFCQGRRQGNPARIWTSGACCSAAPKFEHSYPFCWRCDTPLIYYARESWFIKMTAVKDAADCQQQHRQLDAPRASARAALATGWRTSRTGAVSRNRYWGTPLNIWECECGHRHAIGSIAELKEMSKNCPDDIELHRPYVDQVTITCPDCGRRDAPCARGHRLLVRLRLHALCPASLSL